MSSIQVTPLSTVQINQLTDVFYVMNNSDSNRTRPRGTVHISAKDGDRDTSVAIPNTWLPINLVEYFDLDAIKRSQDIRRTIQAGVIIVISREEAEAILKTGDAQNEILRVREEMKKSRGTSGFMLAETGEKVTISTGGAASSGSYSGPAAQHVPGSVNPVLAVVARYNDGADEQSTMNELFTMAKSGQVPMAHFEEAIGTIKNTSSKIYLAMGDIIGGDTSLQGEADSRGNMFPAGA